ncbi:hypothetical protein VC83_02235 [Pseudogymnoascus destructans]|uniref:Uncharacterized protein n=1 Tax=Pseudogymnoascus destructans TaxID=655981 RepID=A0A177AIE6_9PEZI|nr:uncharacterized protein VC83_02235 [Pseudogymnoascus destructans]OAF61570.1 hypothetical protein VC83_02235 [Pseudogymnoascus destructans]
MPHITNLGTQPIEWFSQLGFTDPISQRRITFETRIAFFVRGSTMCRFDMGLVHERVLGEKRLFVLVTELEDCGEEDELVMLPLVRIKNSTQMIVGLPGIGTKPVYIVRTDPTRRNEPAPFGKGGLRFNTTEYHAEQLSSAALK